MSANYFSGGAPLLGQNLVRLVYLDEAGTDYKVSHLCVAGVIVHGDSQYLQIEMMFDKIVEEYIPREDRRTGFVFHATDIFHGVKYFARDKWTYDRRLSLLVEISRIIDAMNLPIVVGYYKKKEFGGGYVFPSMPVREKEELIHNTAIVDCLMRSDKWLERFAPNELATIVHEDVPRSKKNIKQIVRVLRSADILTANAEELIKFGLPLKRIIDTVHFAAKEEARPLQLADLCAFMFGRLTKGAHVPLDIEKLLFLHSTWMFKDQFGAIGPLPAVPPVGPS